MCNGEIFIGVVYYYEGCGERVFGVKYYFKSIMQKHFFWKKIPEISIFNSNFN